ncbi:MAG: protein TolQ [Hyphomicrobiales bacterium]|nr:protein TolQ [Hyphomicrobiales bacterium]
MPENVIAVPAPEVSSGAEIAAPTQLVDAHAVADMSVIGMFMQASPLVKIVMIVLLFSSVWCWAIIFDKLIRFKALNFKTNKFERAFWSGDMLENLFNRLKSVADHPMAMIFVAGMYEWQESQKSRSETGKVRDYTLKIGIKERIFQAMSVVRSREMDKLERHLGVLATVGSTAPFVGLFGTVWGIMSSFQSIAIMKNTSLAIVAPGIAEALLATAIGLFAAIPAVIFYNKFTNDLSRFANKLDEFSEEFSAIISRELDER